MAEEHITPLAPPRIYPRSDAEMGIAKPRNARQERSSKTFVFFLAFLVFLSIALLVFGLVVLRINAPRVEVKTVEIRNLRYTTSPSASLNMTMVSEITIKNTNFGRFKFQNSSTSVFCGNMTVGSRNIGGGKVQSRETQRMNVTVQVMAGGFAENGNFSSEIGSGLVKLSSYAKFRGEIRVLKKITRRRTAIMNCTMNLRLSTQEIQDLRCL